jgi:hypothetical protein
MGGCPETRVDTRGQVKGGRMAPLARYVPRTVIAALLAGASVLGTGTAMANTAHGAGPAPGHRLMGRQILSGTRLRHRFVPAGSSTPRSEPLTLPDDITRLGGNLFTAFQNGVGPQGQPSADGNQDSTIVEFTPSGRPVQQWDIRGKCDGLTADPARRSLIATVNEDANSSVYMIAPGAPPGGAVRHFSYNRPLPSKGGTDAISIYRGLVLISASAAGTTGAPAPQPSYPAVYWVTFDPASSIARIHPLFFGESVATLANLGPAGRRVRLALTDPDSNQVVPRSARRFRGDFMLTSQGDKEQIYAQRAGTATQRLFVLRLSQPVDDTAWATSRSGRLYATDNAGDAVDMITGRFRTGTVFEAVTPCDANGAPAACPAPPRFPANYVGALNPWTGRISRVPLRGPTLQPQGMIFVSSR